MAIHNAQKKCRLYLGTKKVKKAYLGPIQVYYSGNIVTYMVDGTTYQEEVDEGASCLSPTTFAPEKDGYIFVGWSLQNNGAILESLVMGDNPITMYAVWATETLVAFDSNNPNAYNTTYMAKSFGGKGISAGAHINAAPPYSPKNDNPKTATGTLTIKQIAPYSKVEITFKVRTSNAYTTERVSTATLSGAVSGSSSSATSPYDYISNRTFTLTSSGTINMSVKANINGNNDGDYTWVTTYLDLISVVFKM